MAGRGHSRCRGGGKAGRGHGIRGIRAVLARMHGLVKLGSCSGVGKIGGGGGKKLCTCRGRIEGLRGRIEGLGGRIEGRGGRIEGRGGRIDSAGFHIDSQGQLYAPDSEDEGAGVEVEDVVVEGAGGMELAADGAPIEELAADGIPSVELATVDEALVEDLAADGAPSVEPVAVDEALYEEFAPEVQERVKVVLAGMDPLYHAVFIDMYKLLHQLSLPTPLDQM
ncbi:unnamed protein product [Urochloa humidicola]